jgi:hypothetical protein
MAQLTVRLPDQLAQALEEAAVRLQRGRGEIVRMALTRFLGVDDSVHPARRVRDLLGSLESGIPDLAENQAWSRCSIAARSDTGNSWGSTSPGADLWSAQRQSSPRPRTS